MVWRDESGPLPDGNYTNSKAGVYEVNVLSCRLREKLRGCTVLSVLRRREKVGLKLV